MELGASPLLRYLVSAYRDGTKLGQCVVYALSAESAEANGRFDLVEVLQLNFFDLSVLFDVVEEAE